MRGRSVSSRRSCRSRVTAWSPTIRGSSDASIRGDRVLYIRTRRSVPPRRLYSLRNYSLCRGGRGLLIHRAEEVSVALRMLQLVDQELHRIGDAHRHEDAAENPHLRERAFVDQQLFLAGAGLGDVDRREGAFVRQLAVEDDFRITRSIEFFE